MQYRGTTISELLELAYRYKKAGDEYNAIKLFKKLTKLDPASSTPYHALAHIYKKRLDWKSSMHFSKKAIANDPNDNTAWWHLGIAATALRKWNLARLAWNELGYNCQKSNKAPRLKLGIIPIMLTHQWGRELVWCKQLDPARAEIISIPQPISGRRYKDVLLHDNRPSGQQYIQNRTYSIYEVLDICSNSLYKTFTLTLDTNDLKDVKKLEELCLQNGLGFDNWSHSSQHHKHSTQFFNHTKLTKEQHDFYQVAIAAFNLSEIQVVLEAWRVITLKGYMALCEL